MTGQATDWRDPRIAREILARYRVWAVVGLSSKPWRASFGVARLLIARGKDVVPVHPHEAEVLGRQAYPDLVVAAAARSAAGLAPIEVVDLFRNTELVPPHVEEAIAIGAKAVWMQLDVWNPEAASRARAAGLLVVMDRCPAIDYPVLMEAG